METASTILIWSVVLLALAAFARMALRHRRNVKAAKSWDEGRAGRSSERLWEDGWQNESRH